MKNRLAKERGGLRDSYGAWTMSDEEEAEIFSNLKTKWKKAMSRLRGPNRES